MKWVTNIAGDTVPGRAIDLRVHVPDTEVDVFTEMVNDLRAQFEVYADYHNHPAFVWHIPPKSEQVEQDA
jgi:hypothetical protein